MQPSTTARNIRTTNTALHNTEQCVAELPQFPLRHRLRHHISYITLRWHMHYLNLTLGNTISTKVIFYIDMLASLVMSRIFG